MRNCTTDGCSAELLYDGQNECVLNMGNCCIAYEVLRNHVSFSPWKVGLTESRKRFGYGGGR